MSKGYNDSARMNEGKLPRAETPDFMKGETGKGVSVPTKFTPVKGEKLEVGNDKQAKDLKKVWSKAENANSKFGDF